MEATRSDAADEVMFEGGCNMVLVFEIPTGKPDSDQPTVPARAIFRSLGKLSGSPLPAGADPLLDRYQEYGTAPGLPQARKHSSDVPAHGI
jgi:hypothetical protein